MNSCVLVGDEIVLIECSPLTTFHSKLELLYFEWDINLMGELGYCSIPGYRHKVQELNYLWSDIILIKDA